MIALKDFFGFIRPVGESSGSGDGADIFFHFSEVRDDNYEAEDLSIGDVVAFELTTDRRSNKAKANNVSVTTTVRQQREELLGSALAAGATPEHGTVRRVLDRGFGFIEGVARAADVYFDLVDVLPEAAAAAAAAAAAPPPTRASSDARFGGSDVRRSGGGGGARRPNSRLREGDEVEFIAVVDDSGRVVAMNVKWLPRGTIVTEVDEGELSFIYRCILRESCSHFDSLPLTYLTVKPQGRFVAVVHALAVQQQQQRGGGGRDRRGGGRQRGGEKWGGTLRLVGPVDEDSAVTIEEPLVVFAGPDTVGCLATALAVGDTVECR